MNTRFFQNVDARADVKEGHGPTSVFAARIQT